MLNKYIKNIGFITIFLLFTAFGWHKYYVSVTEIQYNSNNLKLEIIMRVFPDDMEHVLSDTYNIDAHLGDLKTEKFLQTYVHRKFKLRTNDSVLPYEIIGTTQEEAFLVILMEVSLKQKLQSLQVRNMVLQDIFDDQKNIIHFMSGVSKQSYILEKGHSEVSIKITD